MFKGKLYLIFFFSFLLTFFLIFPDIWFAKFRCVIGSHFGSKAVYSLLYIVHTLLFFFLKLLSVGMMENLISLLKWPRVICRFRSTFSIIFRAEPFTCLTKETEIKKTVQTWLKMWRKIRNYFFSFSFSLHGSFLESCKVNLNIL